MVTISPFKALRPGAQYAKQVASKPYDVLSSKEAKIEAQGNPNSFLHITKSEIDLPETVSPYSEAVYIKAKENLDAFISRDILFRENKECYYIYQLVMPGSEISNEHIQTGLVCCSSLKDYDENLIRKHEHTRPEKELDRINHIKSTGAQTGNVFLAYRNNDALDAIVHDWKIEKNPVYDFVSDDKIRHSIWIVNDANIINAITAIFSSDISCTYIADGHHRAASAAKSRTNLKGSDVNLFLTTLFPSNQLQILDYNRVIKDLTGQTQEEFINRLMTKFSITKKDKAVKPQALHHFGMYLNHQWYELELLHSISEPDPIRNLDVTILQDYILAPILGINDQRTDIRIDFIGGIRGLSELEKRVDSGEMAVAFSLYPVSISQLFEVADRGEVMPPKSTWFEPKLRDGLLTHLVLKDQ